MKTTVPFHEFAAGAWLKFVESLPMAVVIVDSGAAILYLNAAAWKLFPDGLEKLRVGSEPRNLAGIFNARVAETGQPYPWKTFPLNKALQGETISVEDLALRLTGENRIFSASAAPILDEGGQVRFAAATFMDISERKKAEIQLKWRNLELESLYTQVREGKEKRQALSKRLLEIQEEERRHISRELHDEVGQALTALKIMLQTMLQTPNGQNEMVIVSARDIGEAVSTIERTLQQVRNLSVNLRPSVLDDLGLTAALRWFVDRQRQLSGIPITFHSHPAVNRLSQDIETACFRMVQEALTNMIRHSRAGEASVKVGMEGRELQLEIADNGIGFDVPKALEKARTGESAGLLGMQERAYFAGGRMKIISDSENGTRIEVCIPLS